MKITYKMAVTVLPLLAFFAASAQNVNRITFEGMEKTNSRKVLQVPSIDGYLSLKGDFHLHTMFSDGNVWPEFRVDEAWSDGLDAIAITEHDTYQPHNGYLKSNQNTPFEIASEHAKSKNIIVVHAIEISKWKMPPGHLNALFITDGNIAELNESSDEALIVAMEKLKKQGAFFLWNHPGWIAQQRDTTRWFDLHQKLYDKGLINGIEVFNYNEWYPVALQWANSKKLTQFANSDAHAPMRWTYDYSNEFIRPMTIVFAKERSEAGLKEAMVSCRTVAWFADNLAGPQDLLSKLFDKSIEVKKVWNNDKNATYEISNTTDFVLNLKTLGEGFGSVTVGRRSAVQVTVPVKMKSVKVEAINWHTDIKSNLVKEIRLN